MSKSRARLIRDDAELDEVREQHLELKKIIDHGRKLETRMTKLQSAIRKNMAKTKAQRALANESLTDCDTWLHTFITSDKIFDKGYHTTSEDEADRVEKMLRALALDYSALFKRMRQPFRAAEEDARIEALFGGFEWPKVLAIAALEQHGQGAFEMHRHVIERGGPGRKYIFVSVGRPGHADDVHKALREKFPGCNTCVKVPQKLNFGAVHAGMDEALHRLAKGMTPQQIAEEVAADMHK